MYFYILINGILGIFSIFRCKQKNEIWDKLSYLLVLLMSILRSTDVGGDLSNYTRSFFEWRRLSINEVFQVRNSNIGFVFINWLIGKFTDNEKIFFAIISVIIVTVIYCFFKSWSRNVSLSFLIFLSIGGYGWILSGIRQTLAIGVLLCAVTYLHEDKIWKYILFLILAVLLHSTAIIGILYFIVVYEKDKGGFIVKNIFLAILCVITAFMGIPYLVQMYRINDYSDLIIRGNGLKLLFFFVAVIVLYYGIIKRENCNNRDKKMYFAVKSCEVGCSIQILSYGFSLLTRLADYFFIFFSVLIPNILMDKKKDKLLVFTITIIMFTLFCGFNLRDDPSGILPYKFIWQK